MRMASVFTLTAIIVLACGAFIPLGRHNRVIASEIFSTYLPSVSKPQTARVDTFDIFNTRAGVPKISGTVTNITTNQVLDITVNIVYITSNGTQTITETVHPLLSALLPGQTSPFVSSVSQAALPLSALPTVSIDKAVPSTSEQFFSLTLEKLEWGACTSYGATARGIIRNTQSIPIRLTDLVIWKSKNGTEPWQNSNTSVVLKPNEQYEFTTSYIQVCEFPNVVGQDIEAVARGFASP